MFGLSRNMPGDPVEQMLDRQGYSRDGADQSKYQKEYQRVATELGLDQPWFYLSLSTQRWRHIPYPTLSWNGSKNQYHQWLRHALHGQLGQSTIDSRSVWSKISSAIGWSLGLALSALLLVSCIGIPIGIYLYRQPAAWLRGLLLILYCIPVFWMGTLLITFCTSGEYSPWLDLFPAPGLWPDDSSWISSLGTAGGKLILPIACLVLHSLAYMAQMTAASMKTEAQLPYYQTALAKGLSRRSADYRHALRNASLPIATLIIDALPRTLAGSLIIEVLFNLPGMGRLTMQSIRYQDWNVLFTVVLLISGLTMLSFLLGDLVYRWLNPKIQLDD